LLAALNDLTGKILAERAPRHRHQGWLKFLTTIDSSTPSKVDLHLILDNDATHKQHKVGRFLRKRHVGRAGPLGSQSLPRKRVRWGARSSSAEGRAELASRVAVPDRSEIGPCLRGSYPKEDTVV